MYNVHVKLRGSAASVCFLELTSPALKPLASRKVMMAIPGGNGRG